MIGVLLIRLEGLEGVISKSSIFFFFPLADVKSKSLIGQYGYIFLVRWNNPLALFLIACYLPTKSSGCFYVK